MKFTANGFISTKNGNTVEVENVRYWISGQDVLRVAQSRGVATERLRSDQYGIDGQEIKVVVHKDDNGIWAELADQENFCPNVI